MMIARKLRFGLMPAVMLGMVACNLSDQADIPKKPVSPAAPSEATVAVDTTLEEVDIDAATFDSLMRVSDALGHAGLAEEERDSATWDSLIRLSGTSDSAIESRDLESEAGPVAAKASAASNSCPYAIYKQGGGTCTDPYPAWGFRGVDYVSPRIGLESLNGVRSLPQEMHCWDGFVRNFAVRLAPGRTHVKQVLASCGIRAKGMEVYNWIPRYDKPLRLPPGEHRIWDGLLVGLRARSGDWINALGPIILKNGRLSTPSLPFGNLNGGAPIAMLCPRNYYVAGFRGYIDRDGRHGLTGLRMVCKDSRPY